MKHPDLVKALLKPGAEIWMDLTPAKTNLVHLTLGIAGEAGEIVDAVKKAIIYGQALDYNNMLEELGDMEFYLEGLRQALGFTRKQVLDANISKLKKRYEKGYSDQAAFLRADKTKTKKVCRTKKQPPRVQR